MSVDLKDLVADVVKREVQKHRGKTKYREPLVGFAPANHPGFGELKRAVGPEHLLPHDLLPGARSVVAFFLPFAAEVVEAHRRDPFVSRLWAEAYIETNELITRACRALAGELAALGIEAAWQEPTHNFDPVSLRSFWSHKHVAYLCGLGTFGLHHMLITPSGCAGRLGSLVVSADLSPTDPPEREFCLYRREGRCGACVSLCPTGALSAEGLDKQKCYRHLLEVDAFYADLGTCDVCGKCATGPCALGVPEG